MFVEELKDTTEWEQFLQACPNATFYHTPQWKHVLGSAFSQPLYLAVRDKNGNLVGVCPGFIVKSGMVKIYQSNPRSDYAGPIISPTCFGRAFEALMAYLMSLSHRKGVAYAKLNLMDADFKRFFPTSALTESNVGGVVELDLKATPYAYIWSKIVKQKMRTKIRAIEKHGFRAEEAKTKSDLKEFYKLYASNMRYIGASPFPYLFMEKAWDLLYPENFRVMLVRKDRAIAGTANFKYGRGTYGAYVGMDRTQCRTYPIMAYLALEEVKRAEAEGRDFVSFGSTPNDPSERYYLQKMDLGGNYRKQTTVWVPSNTAGHFLVLSRNKTIATWKSMRDFLPVGFKRGLEKRLEAF
jgi:hypothetical protein